jgi:23S rRNA (cytosine1962-C5)-methyltransferase
LSKIADFSPTLMKTDPIVRLLDSPAWHDYELLDSGNGLKLERFGPYRLVRPEVQAMWQRALPESQWRDVNAIFRPTSEESGGHWDVLETMTDRWQMGYALAPGSSADERGRHVLNPVPSAGNRGELRFWAMTTPGRHLGVFPEGAAHWDWCANLIAGANRPVRVLSIWVYRVGQPGGSASAAVTHVDASRKSVGWARENQALSGLGAFVRWIVDDALKFVQREARRGNKYDGILLDPPKFGRGPKGEVWEVYKSLPNLGSVRAILNRILFVVLTIYAVRAPALHLNYSLQDMLRDRAGGWNAAAQRVRRAPGGYSRTQCLLAGPGGEMRERSFCPCSWRSSCTSLVTTVTSPNMELPRIHIRFARGPDSCSAAM